MVVLKIIGFCVLWALLSNVLERNNASVSICMFVGGLMGMLSWIMNDLN